MHRRAKIDSSHKLAAIFRDLLMTSFTRSLNFAGATNFRDLGGYPGRNGRLVQWRKLFRSDQLAGLTADDRAAVGVLGLKSAFDLRGTEERLPVYQVDGLTVHSLPIEPVIVSLLTTRLASGTPLSAAETAEMVRDSYRNYVRSHTPIYRTLFKHLVEDSAPLVIHCTAGKDRTGFAAALILTSLGVSHELVVEDYLLTNQFWRAPQSVAHTWLPTDVRAVLLSVETSFLAAALDAIKSDYGNLDSYLEDGLGLGHRERETLEAHYLAA
jgi:protein-tyrosine phosphatase